ncbi:hypothetical protein [Kitasatospora sp. NPDC058046]|uniref:hypothetical protein n=1 Tax=Kitasatospora sp. NPDC058046 TaxID=3346312 RepID=UPI0036D8252E
MEDLAGTDPDHRTDQARGTPADPGNRGYISLRAFFADPDNHAPRACAPAGAAPAATRDEPPAPSVIDSATGKVRVMSSRCGTCIGRHGNPVGLSPQRLRELAGLQPDGTYDEGHTVCHITLEGNPDHLPAAVCAWVAEHPQAAPRSLVMRQAASKGILYIDPPAPGRP